MTIVNCRLSPAWHRAAVVETLSGVTGLLLQRDQVEVDDAVADCGGIYLVGPGVNLGLDLFNSLGTQSPGSLGKSRKFNVIRARARRCGRCGPGICA